MFYKITRDTELMYTEPLLLGKYRVGFPQALGITCQLINADIAVALVLSPVAYLLPTAVGIFP